MSPQQKVIDQVLKLLALADDPGATEGEKDTAKAMAEKLMLKHDLQISDVEETVKEFAEYEFDTGNVNSVKTRRQLANMCARFNGCYMVFTEGFQSRWGGSKYNTKYTFTGRPQDIENTIYMYEILIKQAKDQCKVASKQFKSKYGRVFNHRENLSFYLGFNSGVQEKLNALKEVVKNKKQEEGLVPVSVFDQLRERAEQMAKEKDPNIRNVRNRGNSVNRNAYAGGREAGSNASITRGVGGSGGGTLRLS